MKDYKLLLVGILVFILVVVIGIFIWLWSSNRKNSDPLPISVSINEPSGNNDVATIPDSALYIQAETSLKTPLDILIEKFKARYPSIQVHIRYVPSTALLLLPKSDDNADINNTNVSTDAKTPLSDLNSIDLILTNDKITKKNLAPLQQALHDTQAKRNAITQLPEAHDSRKKGETEYRHYQYNNQAYELTSFSYAIRQSKTIDGVILTDNPNAISFRNFLLASSGQDVLKQYGYSDIDGYKNSMDDLFNSESSNKRARGESSVKLTDALNSGD